MEIKLENLSFSYGSTPIIKDINLVIDKPELVCILGPNGAGKSTLMHCMNKLQTPTSGTVYLDGKDLASYSLKELAKLVSFVPHSEDTTFSMTVLDTVLMGRMPHTGTIMSQEDVLIAAENIKLLGMQDFAMHGFDELSAGQHQKVMIARSLTQEPKVMLLDEPTANLDVKFQMLVMRLLRDVARLKGITVVTICHNHPSGSVRPSRQDDALTQQVRQACEVMRLHFMDHVIVVDGNYYSYREEGRV